MPLHYPVHISLIIKRQCHILLGQLLPLMLLGWAISSICKTCFLFVCFVFFSFPYSWFVAHQLRDRLDLVLNASQAFQLASQSLNIWRTDSVGVDCEAHFTIDWLQVASLATKEGSAVKWGAKPKVRKEAKEFRRQARKNAALSKSRNSP